jgi:hypothetical protein
MIKNILIAGVFLLSSTQMMAAKKAKEAVGNVMYNKAYIDCTMNGKTVVNDYVEYDNIGFDYTKFKPKLTNSGDQRVSCSVSGYLELPADYVKPKIDLMVENACSKSLYFCCGGSNFHRCFTINQSNYSNDGKFLNSTVITKSGKKYVSYQFQIYQNIELHFMDGLSSLPSHTIGKFFDVSTQMPVISTIKYAQKRGEEDEIIPLDTSKIFIFEE